MTEKVGKQPCFIFNELIQKSASSRNEVSFGMNGFFIFYITNLKTKK